MLCPDVNVLVLAFRADTSHHQQAHTWLDAAQRGSEPVVVLAEVAAAVVRILTNPRAWAHPSTSTEVLACIDDLVTSPCVVLAEGPVGRWPRFAEMLKSGDFSGNDVPDVFLAAAAIDLGATLVTFDRGFSRFDGLALQLL